jgi:hypothetical protein
LQAGSNPLVVFSPGQSDEAFGAPFCPYPFSAFIFDPTMLVGM